MDDGVYAAARCHRFSIRFFCPCGSDRERQNSISLIGMEWHQTMAKYIIKRVAMGIFSIFIVATVTFFVMNLVPGGPFVAEKSISAAAQQALAE